MIDENSKGVILLGPSATGKSRIADLISAGKKRISIGRFSPKLKMQKGYVKEDTEVLYIDDARLYPSELSAIYKIIDNGLPTKNGTIVRPQVIISCGKKRQNLLTDPECISRFHVFELRACNPYISSENG